MQIACSVVGCEFRTEYLASVLAEKQSSEHWRARHKAKFDQDELDRLDELEEQRIKFERQKMRNDQKLENEKLFRKMQEQEILRKVRL